MKSGNLVSISVALNFVGLFFVGFVFMGLAGSVFGSSTPNIVGVIIKTCIISADALFIASAILLVLGAMRGFQEKNTSLILIAVLLLFGLVVEMIFVAPFVVVLTNGVFGLK
jgi:hypothetical protein